jgi:hypothetical protein
MNFQFEYSKLRSNEMRFFVHPIPFPNKIIIESVSLLIHKNFKK